MKENFWRQEPLVSDVDGELLPCDGVGAGELLDVLPGLSVELVELLGNVGAHVAVSFLDCLGHFHGLFRGNSWKYFHCISFEQSWENQTYFSLSE